MTRGDDARVPRVGEWRVGGPRTWDGDEPAWKFPETRPFLRRSVARKQRESIEEARQRRWSELGRCHESWPAAAREAHRLTVELNGHADELDRLRRATYDASDERELQHDRVKRRSYLEGPSGLWAERRRRRWEARGGAHPDAPSRRIGALMWSNRGSASEDVDAHDLAEMPSREAAVMLDSGNGISTAVGSGGDHDRVRLVYHALRPRFQLVELHLALTSRGKPMRLREVQEEAERIVLALNDAHVSKTEIGCLFGCSRKTITRICQRAHVVPTSPRGEDDMTNQVLQRLNAQDQTLYRIEQTLAAIADALSRGDESSADEATRVFDFLLAEAQLSEPA